MAAARLLKTPEAAVQLAAEDDPYWPRRGAQDGGGNQQHGDSAGTLRRKFV